MKSILITGVAGFIGSHLADFFLKKNMAVFGIDNFITGSRTNLNRLNHHSLFNFIELDVCESWQEIKNKTSKHKIDFVFHFASPAAVNQFQQYRLETMWVNSVGLKNALDFADVHNARLIFSSTSEIYGSPLRSPQKETDWGHVNTFGPRASYDEAKRFGESLVYTHNQVHKTKHGLVRIFNTYGPFMNPGDGRALVQFVRKALKNQDLEIYGNGQQTRSFCYIDDLIRGLADYAESDISQPMNLGNDFEITISALAKLVLEITRSNSKIKYLNSLPDDPVHRKPDLQLARTFLNFRCQTNLEQGIRKLIEKEI